jgi:hypothetical protein
MAQLKEELDSQKVCKFQLLFAVRVVMMIVLNPAPISARE